jgi:hypothetical protein
MNAPSSAPNQLLEALSKLKEQYQTPEPLNAERLLYLCCSIYIRGREACYVNYMEGATALLSAWYTELPKFDTIHTRNYPAFVYPDVCYCGIKVSPTGSNLRRHCKACRGDSTKQLVGAYDIQRLAMIANINERYLESVFAKVIYHDY